MPKILPEVNDYFECFMLCDSQLRAGFGGVFALDWNVVIRVALAKGMNINERFFTMLKAFENEMLKEINKDNGK